MKTAAWPLLVLLAGAGPASANTWHAHYEQGMDLLQAGDAPAAEIAFREALKRRATSGCRARTYGVHFRDYIPHYYLGVALSRQGRTADAALEFSRELAAGAIDRCPATTSQSADLRVQLSRLALPEPDGASAGASGASAIAATTGLPPAASAGGVTSATAAAQGAGWPAASAPAAPGFAPPAAGATVPGQTAPAAPASRPRSHGGRHVPPLVGMAWSQDLGGGLALLDGHAR